MNEYERWLKDRELQQAAMGRVNPPTQRPATVEGDVLVPTLQAAAVGICGGLVSSTVVLLFGFGTSGWARVALAGKALGAGFVFSLAFCMIVFIGQHRRWITEPLNIIRDRLDALLDLVYGRRPDELNEPGYVVIHPHMPQLPATIDHEVKSIEPSTDAATKRLYDFIIRVWPGGNVSRRAVMDLGFSRRTWERYVGGRRGHEGEESGRGILDRAGVVIKTTSGWEIGAPLDQALQITDPLAAYSNAKARLVAGRDGLGQAGPTQKTGIPARPGGVGDGA